MADWIACSERLPEESQCVLTFDPVGRGIGYYRDGGWWNLYGGPTRVTHWQPLPEPPK